MLIFLEKISKSQFINNACLFKCPIFSQLSILLTLQFVALKRVFFAHLGTKPMFDELHFQNS